MVKNHIFVQSAGVNGNLLTLATFQNIKEFTPRRNHSNAPWTYVIKNLLGLSRQQGI
jgi:hypothetical protein